MLRNIRLQRPLAAIDLETTGLLEDGARIVELAIIIVDPDGAVAAYVRRVNPGIPIPPTASLLHGITDDQVVGCPTFGDIASVVLDLVHGCDLTGFNINRFDLRVLGAELIRVGPLSLKTAYRRVVDVMEVFHATLPLGPHGRPIRGTGTLQAACRTYLGGPFPGAHGALIDALASLQVLDAIAGHHRLSMAFDDLVCDLEAMVRERR